jgi:hypothetical protein
VTYTLWSRGRLLGTTDLSWARSLPRQRAGDLHPTPLGETLLPVACGARPALRLHGHDFEHPAVRTAIARSEALRLELRGPDGEVVATEDLWIQDSEYLRSIADEPPPCAEDPSPEWMEDLELDAYDPEREAELAELEIPDLPEPEEDEAPEEREWPRYQVMLTLVDDAAIP